GGQLLRLRPRQEHAVIKGVEKTAFADPAFFLHQNAVHDRDLPGRAAEGEQGDARPHPNRLAKRHRGFALRRLRLPACLNLAHAASCTLIGGFKSFCDRTCLTQDMRPARKLLQLKSTLSSGESAVVPEMRKSRCGRIL